MYATESTPINHNSSISNSTLEMVGSPILRLALPVVYLLVFILSTPCNLISFWLLCCHTKHKTPTIVFAINLSLTDLLYSVFLPFQIAYHFRGNDWPFGDAMCSVVTVVFYGNMHCSILTTCAISLERYWGIVHPLRTKHWRTGVNSALTCLLIWVCVLVVHISLLYNKLTFRVSELNVTTCFDIIPKSVFSHKILGYLYFGVVLVLFSVLPLFVLVGCYTAIICKLHRTRDLDTPQRAKRQTMRLIVVVVLCFVCCYLPNIVLQLLHMVYSLRGKSLYVYYKLSLGLNSLNCCFDPFIYYFASREFRKKLWAKFTSIAGEHEEETSSELGIVSKGSTYTSALQKKQTTSKFFHSE